jgi:hypothetical protein
MSEEWRSVVGFEGYYEVSSLGQVRSVSRTTRRANGRMYPLRGRIRKQNTTWQGYKTVDLGKGQVKVHRLVAEAFIANPDRYEFVNHKNFDKGDNHVDNLEWVSRGQNAEHAVARICEGCSKLSRQDVRDIFIAFHVDGRGLTELSNTYSVNIRTVSTIVKRIRWKYATEDLTHLAAKADVRYIEGPVEIWGDIPRLPGISVSDRGVVRCDSKVAYSTYYSNGGYLGIVSQGRRADIHRLVAEAFVPNPYGYRVVDHIDGDKQNNRASNLQWCSKSENTLRAHRSGRAGKIHGSQNASARLTEGSVVEIRRLYASGQWSQRALGRRFGVSYHTIRRVVLGWSWKHVVGETTEAP